jgi:NAD-dependent DNA ligase
MVKDDIKITDVALGLSWSNYWQNNKLDKKYGERTKIELTVGWQYPYNSVDEFVDWFTKVYLVKEKEKTERIVVERNNPILPIENLKAENVYSSKTILLTGFSKEDKYKRLPPILEFCNITLGKSVSKSLDYLICGPNNSISGKFAEIGKQAKAKALGIKIVPAEDFIDEITNL